MLNKNKYVKTKHGRRDKDIVKLSRKHSKENKIKSNHRNLLPSHTAFQEYNCDIYGLTKAQSVSRTQLQRANRVLTIVDQLQRYSSAAARGFTDILDNLRNATNNGTTCKGETLDAEGKAIFNILNNCSVSVPAVCNLDRITSYNQTVNNTITECIPLLKKYGYDYKVSLNSCSKKIYLCCCFSRKSCSTTLVMTQKMCANIWDS